MGRDAGGHAHRDPLRAVDQQVGDAHGEHAGFPFSFVKVGQKIHHVFVQVRQVDFLGDPHQPGFGVAHGRRSVPLDGAEVPVAVHQGLAPLELLGHDHQGFVDGAVSVGMVFTHGVADDTRAFPVWTVVADAQFVHIVQSPPLYRLEPVADIRQGAGDDHAHGIIDVRLLHLF